MDNDEDGCIDTTKDNDDDNDGVLDPLMNVNTHLRDLMSTLEGVQVSSWMMTVMEFTPTICVRPQKQARLYPQQVVL